MSCSLPQPLIWDIPGLLGYRSTFLHPFAPTQSHSLPSTLGGAASFPDIASKDREGKQKFPLQLIETTLILPPNMSASVQEWC